VILDDQVDPVRRRPWWFSAALVGVMGGAIVGLFIARDALPPCTPPNAAPEIVVERFLARLGSSTDALRDCFTTGRPTDYELDMYAAAAPPASYRVGLIGVGRNGPNNSGDASFTAIQVFASWRDGAPELWTRDDFRWIVLRRHEAPTRWTIDQTLAPRRP
jgi:hypothetical protein